MRSLFCASFRRLQSTSTSAKATAFPSAKTCPPPTSNNASVPLSKRQLRNRVPCLDEPISIVQHAGSRIFLLKSTPQSLLSSAQLLTIQNKIYNYEENHIVGAYLVSSESTEFFSLGVDYTKQGEEILDAVSSLAQLLTGLQTAGVVTYAGKLTGTAYSTFANMQYRCGTQTTKFSIPDLLEGRLPLGGSLGHHLAHGCDEGVEMARYLAVSGRVITSYDMRGLGLVSYIVEDEPHFLLARALAESFSESDDIKSVQNHGIDGDCIPVLLETMDVNSEGFDLTESAIKQMDDHFNELCLVKPIPVPVESFFSEENMALTGNQAEDLEDICEEVAYCFQSDDIEECKARVRKNTNKWSDGLAEKMESISPKLLKEWFHLTRYAKQATQEEYGKKEIEIVRSFSIAP
eukprot:gene28510-37464_t